MAKWYEKANEASFKPVSGGYIFQSPNPWLFARPRYYLVNDDQKAAIMPYLQRWRLIMLVMAAVLVPAMVAAMFFMQAGLHYPRGLSIAIGTALVLIPMLLIPHVYLLSVLRPLLAGLPRTDQRFTWRDQFERTAVAAPKKMLMVGAGGGGLMILGGLMGLIDAIMDGRAGMQLFGSVPTIIFGALLAAYFFGLVRFKAKVAQGTLEAGR